MKIQLNKQLHKYFEARTFDSEESLNQFLNSDRVFRHQKRLYFDEVENANVWSFFLVDRDLHHTFEEYIIARGLPPYAIWSKPDRENVDDGIGRSTFPIAETAAMYSQPVPRAGDTLDYVLEILLLDDKSAIFGFLGFLVTSDGQRKLNPSVASAWLRVFVKYEGTQRSVTTIPDKLRKVLETNSISDFIWANAIT